MGVQRLSLGLVEARRGQTRFDDTLVWLVASEGYSFQETGHKRTLLLGRLDYMARNRIKAFAFMVLRHYKGLMGSHVEPIGRPAIQDPASHPRSWILPVRQWIYGLHLDRASWLAALVASGTKKRGQRSTIDPVKRLSFVRRGKRLESGGGDQSSPRSSISSILIGNLFDGHNSLPSK